MKLSAHYVHDADIKTHITSRRCNAWQIHEYADCLRPDGW